jgi:hypothetical protein
MRGVGGVRNLRWGLWASELWSDEKRYIWRDKAGLAKCSQRPACKGQRVLVGAWTYVERTCLVKELEIIGLLHMHEHHDACCVKKVETALGWVHTAALPSCFQIRA